VVTRSPSPTALFPRDRQFWGYHVLLALGACAISLATLQMYGSFVAREVAAATLWVLPFTLAALGFRWLYKRRSWRALSSTRQLPLVLAYGTLAGLAVAAAVAAMLWPAFGPTSVRRVVGDGLQAQLFLCAWSFIYISVTGQRHLRDTEVANLQLQGSLREAQLDNLASQLNPHFLFNSLNNIRFMLHENASLADSNLVALSEILRYSLESGQHTKVRLSRELDIVRRYVDIVRAQYEERLRFTLHTETSHEACLVPPMALHLLVENAVKHGIDDLRDGGLLAVSVSASGERLHLRVLNDVPPAASGHSAGAGVGLRNIERRLQLLYGGAARLLVTRHPARFEVLLDLPLETTPDQ
jgi:two-component sensor histidine kinase